MGPGPSKVKGLRRLGVVSALTLYLLTAPTLVRAGVGEAELTAAYLYNFSKFVTWPADVFPSARSPLILCVYGLDAPGKDLEALSGKRAQGHPVLVRRRPRGESLAGCHLAYIDASERRYLAPLLRSIADRPILTVSEIPGFVAAGGMIGLLQRENRLAFEVNIGSAEGAGLSISSQLLKLAVRVVRDRKP